ncbi:MAG: hypothetical protein IAE95_07710 [Chitinophagaceae bacterium]|nr:hypothetical protein [Chitinophagaceae bacterium]
MNLVGKAIALVAILFPLITGCHSKLVPQSPSDIHFNESVGRTIYSTTPWGIVSIPDKWAAGKYNKTTKQQYFYHKDTATLIVSVGACKSYSFGKDVTAGYDFVKKYYEVESKYNGMLEQPTRIIEENEKDRYIIWTMRADGIDQYIICGVKDCTCNECGYRTIHLKSRKYSADKAVTFLKDAFLQ